MELYDDYFFRQRVEESLKLMDRILEVHRNPRLPHEVDHEYSDKYLLVEQMTNTALIGLFNILVYFGLSANVLASIDKSKSTTLRFHALQSCTFLRTSTVPIVLRRKQERIRHEQVSQTYIDTTVTSVTKQVVDNVPVYHWKVENNWEISIISGSTARKVIKQRSSTMELEIKSDSKPPLPEHCQFPAFDVSLSGMLALINVETMTPTFAINRQGPTTRTPRRNEEIESFLTVMKEMDEWADQVAVFFKKNVKGILDSHKSVGPTLIFNANKVPPSLPIDNIVPPVLPFMEQSKNTTREALLEPSSDSTVTLSLLTLMDSTTGSSTPILSANDVCKMLNQHVRSIEELIVSLQKTYPSPVSTALLSVEEALIMALCIHTGRLHRFFNVSVNYVEHMLRNQLVAAVGKIIGSSDVDQFMRYHNARLLQSAPVAFCHSIRQPNHDPVGLVSIESTEPDGSKLPIQTLSRKVDVSSPFKLPLNAQTTVELTGQTFLHGWIRHRFGKDQKSFELIARARQFSVFLLVVGTMSGMDTLDPKDAIIVQNKDEVLIPLLLDEIPTAKEFKDAIRSLSPEQQRFAQAFRSMKLRSSVMGICVIQIKPQLEVLLGLGQGSLMKEMKLTQDLMELFIAYQVPSDLVCYDGIDPGASSKEKVENVRSHVNSVLDVIGKAKEPARSLDIPPLKECFERATPFCRAQLSSDEEEDVEPDTDDEEEEGSLGTSCQSLSDHSSIPDGDNHAPGDQNQPLCDLIGTPDFTTPDRSRDSGTGASFTTSLPMGTTQGLPMDQANGTTPLQHVEDHVSPSISSLASVVEPVSRNHMIKTQTNFTALPQVLNSRIEAQAGGAAMRSTTIKLGDTWQRNRQENLLGKPEHSFLTASESIKAEKNKAFDLLDALSRSGSLPIAFSELHVIVAVTHAFEKDLIDTVIQDNINPIEKLEMSTLLVGSAIHGVSASALLREESQLSRLAVLYPCLVNARR